METHTSTLESAGIKNCSADNHDTETTTSTNPSRVGCGRPASPAATVPRNNDDSAKDRISKDPVWWKHGQQQQQQQQQQQRVEMRPRRQDSTSCKSIPSGSNDILSAAAAAAARSSSTSTSTSTVGRFAVTRIRTFLFVAITVGAAMTFLQLYQLSLSLSSSSLSEFAPPKPLHPVKTPRRSHLQINNPNNPQQQEKLLMSLGTAAAPSRNKRRDAIGQAQVHADRKSKNASSAIVATKKTQNEINSQSHAKGSVLHALSKKLQTSANNNQTMPKNSLLRLGTVENQTHKIALVSTAEHGNKHSSKNNNNNNNNNPHYQEESFAACLLLMDDNHRLTEWLAYHYFVLPLRYLVVAVDPRSKTSPSALLQPWRDVLGMTIVEWTDPDFNFTTVKQQQEGEQQQLDNNNGTSTSTSSKSTTILLTRAHRNRQRIFYNHCTRHLQAKNQTWTAYIDVDEYMSLNSILVGRQEAETLMSQSGSILRFVKDRIRQDPDHKFLQTPCSSVPRIFYGAVESSPHKINRGVPPTASAWLNASRFDTLRWRYRTAAYDVVLNGKAKAIMDVSLLSRHFTKFQVHRPIPSCPSATVGIDKVPILLHHYLGSWESYSFRDDARRGWEKSRQVWEIKANVTFREMDEGRSWLRGFLEQVTRQSGGKERVVRDLLAPAGVFAASSESATDASQHGGRGIDWNDTLAWAEKLEQEIHIKRNWLIKSGQAAVLED